MSVQFKIGKKYSLLYVSDWLASTTLQEIVIDTQSPDGRFVFKEKNGRKKFYLPADRLAEYLVFEGHGLPIQLDTDTNSWRGNALINLITNDPQQVKNFILDKCLNQSAKNLSLVTFSSTDRDANNREYTSFHSIE